MPRYHRGTDVAEWNLDCGFADKRPRDLPDASLIHRPPPLTGPHRTFSLQSLSAAGVTLLGRLVAVEGAVLRFADDIAANIRAGDEGSAMVRRDIDACIARLGLDAPAAEPDPAETVEPVLPVPPIAALDIEAAGIGAVIWATGFDGDYAWLRLPGVLDDHGRPLHEDGASPWPGVFYMGLPWMTRRRSALIVGLPADAPWIAGLVAARLGRAMPSEAPPDAHRQPDHLPTS
jgi:putative flavoprotein involved in K+ transport